MKHLPMYFFLATSLCAGAAGAEKPNVLFILTEDQGPHLSYLGTPGIETPNMDTLANSGVYFNAAHVTYPVCSASKASIFTGRYNSANGLRNNTVNYHQPAAALTTAEKNAPLFLRNRIRQEVPTLTERLHEAGYYQGVTHKLHVAPNEKFPYDEFLREPNQQMITDFIHRAGEAKKPWFLLNNIGRSHRPFPNSDLVPIRVDPNQVKLPAFLPDTPVLRQDWAEYLAAIELADRAVGQALEALRLSGQESNTIVVFAGDHGPAFQRGKMMLNTLGLRVPLIIRAPGLATEGRSDSLVSTVDIMPTLLDLLSLPALAECDGRTLRPVLQGNMKAKIHDFIFAEITHRPLAPDRGMQERTVLDDRFQLIVREGLEKEREVNADLKDPKPWGNRAYAETIRVKDQFPEAYKFLTWMDPQPLGGQTPAFELYETAADPDEMKNLAGDRAYQSEFARLHAALRQWSKSIGDTAMKYDSQPKP